MNEIVKISADGVPQMDQILCAVAKAMGNVKRIAKEGMNTHDKYAFASIDDFLAALNPICAEAGLIFHMQEQGCEEFTRKGKFGDTAWLKVQFGITVYHVSGQSLPTVTRSVEVIRSGAQAYGSAQSYVLKQFMRSLLLVPTGDKDDADYGEKGDGLVDRKPVAEPKRQEPQGPTKEALTIAANSLVQAATLDALQAIWRDLPRDVQAAASVIAAKDWRKTELTVPKQELATANADLGGDAIPY